MQNLVSVAAVSDRRPSLPAISAVGDRRYRVLQEARKFSNRIRIRVATGLITAALATEIGAGTAMAVPESWSSFQDVVPNVSPVNGNPISSITYISSSTIFAPNHFSAVYFIVTALGAIQPVGGFDVVNGKVVRSSFNGYGAYYGLWSGDTANSAEGSNPQNHYPGGYWETFYDKNGDGTYGLADTSVQGVFIDRNEQLDPSQYTISNFTPYGSANPGGCIATGVVTVVAHTNTAPIREIRSLSPARHLFFVFFVPSW